ncbi:MAG: hypothetical protein OHK0029_35290 [Armatimonadaceae bacterium]
MKNAIFATGAIAALLLGACSGAFAQEKPTLLKENLPKEAICLVCSQNGEEHGAEKPAGAVVYKGKTYYFCAKKEIEAFLKDPEAFIPAPLPRLAPGFTLKNLAGEPVSFAELSKDRVLLVDFWATWCAPCIKAMPELQALHTRFAPTEKFSVVGISLDEEGAKKVSPFLARQKTKYTYPMLLDSGDTWQKWGVKGLPSLLLVKDGQILHHWTGKIDPKEVEKVVASTLKQD